MNGRVDSMMKLVIAVVQNEDADAVVDALLEDEFRATRLASTGGFLRRGNTTLMIGADEDQVDRVLDLIRQHTRTGMAPAEDETAMTPPAAATVFVLDLEEYQRL
ncbi:MAG TPA: cyclic-di-AMP receptor [Thermomicrobiales bacterium]